MKAIFAALVIVPFVTGCIEPTAEPTEIKDAQAQVNALQFVKHPNGLCFGVSSYSRYATNGGTAMGLTMVNVPCDKVGL